MEKKILNFSVRYEPTGFGYITIVIEGEATPKVFSDLNANEMNVMLSMLNSSKAYWNGTMIVIPQLP